MAFGGNIYSYAMNYGYNPGNDYAPNCDISFEYQKPSFNSCYECRPSYPNESYDHYPLYESYTNNVSPSPICEWVISSSWANYMWNEGVVWYDKRPGLY